MENLSFVVKSEPCGFISCRVGESKKTGNPYLMVEFKGRYKIDMLYTENPSKMAVDYFSSLEFGDKFVVDYSINHENFIAKNDSKNDSKNV